MSDSDIKPKDTNALARLGGGGPSRSVEGLEDYSDRDLGVRPPELRIVHAVKKAEDTARPGDYRLGRLPPARVIEVSFLKSQKSRWLQEGEKQNKRNTCVSLDQVTPMQDIPNPKAEFCADCAYGQWTDDPVLPDKRVPPPCSEAHVFLGIYRIPDTNQPYPFWFVCRASASAPAREFLQTIRRMAMPGPDQIRSMRELRVRLTTQQGRSAGGRVSNDGVIWYVPIFTILDDDPDQRATRRGELGPLFEAARDLAFVPDIRLEETPEEPGSTGNGGPASGGPDLPF